MKPALSERSLRAFFRPLHGTHYMKTTETVDVYRIQDADGRGPYVDRGNFHKDWISWEFNGPRHPNFGQDYELRREVSDDPDLYHFGFRSIEQFRFWFHQERWRKALQESGFRLTKWRVPAGMAHLSDAQAIFRRDLSTLVETTDIPE